MWEQMVFVAMEQAQKVQASNDIRQYGTVKAANVRTEVLQLQPTQTIRKFHQTTLSFNSSRRVRKDARIVNSLELQEMQTEIERQVGVGQIKKKQQYTPYDRGKLYTQSRVKQFCVHNNNSLGHRYMARSPLPGVTRKINNLNLI